MQISIVNHTNGSVTDDELQRVLRAINRQIREDFAPYWGMHATLRLEGRSVERPDTMQIPDLRGDAVIYLWDQVDVDGALGYHAQNARGIPFGFVFTILSQRLGEPWSVTLSHEALELIADPETNLLAMGPHPSEDRDVFHWFEMCDAVQNETYGIDGVAVSNFVLPLYFTGTRDTDEVGARNDFLGLDYGGQTLKSFGINPGGYVGFFDPELGDHDTFTVRGDSIALMRMEQKSKARETRRAVRYRSFEQREKLRMPALIGRTKSTRALSRASSDAREAALAESIPRQYASVRSARPSSTKPTNTRVAKRRTRKTKSAAHREARSRKRIPLSMNFIDKKLMAHPTASGSRAASATSREYRVSKQRHDIHNANLDRQTSRVTHFVSTAICLFFLLISGCGSDRANQPVADDEAMLRAIAEEKTPQQAARDYFYPRHIEDYFPGMDSIGQVAAPHQLLSPSEELVAQFVNADQEVASPDLTPNETLGRNTWMIWCAGNEGFWDWLANENLGFIDFVKLVDSRRRNQRFSEAGMVNEPNTQPSSRPSTSEFGLWLDQPTDDHLREWRQSYVAQTFDQIRAGIHKSQRGLKSYRGDPKSIPNNGRYDSPEVYVAADRSSEHDGESEDYEHVEYGKIPPPDIYGLSSGVIGLRLFPNPNFDAKAQRKWDAKRYYEDRSYWSDPKLVRPYRVGMSCAFCHASFHPLKPPRDVTHPEWENISGNIGAQYLRMRPTVGNLLTKDEFVYHLLESQPAGTIDTSLIASDNINNPNTFNAIFRLPERGLLSFRNPRERLSASSASLPSLWQTTTGIGDDSADPVPESWRAVLASQELDQELENSNSNPRRTPRILLDGSDSIGAWGAFARVYLNIGSYYERWNQVHQPLLGFEPQRPFSIADCKSHSVYWNATTLRVGPMRDYFLKITPPMPLLLTEGSGDRLKPIDELALRQRADAREQEYSELLTVERARHIDVTKLAHGRKVFAKNCVVCHSSIQPESSEVTLFLPGNNETAEQSAQRSQQGEEYSAKHKELIERRNNLRNEWAAAGEHWDHDPGQWLRDPAYLKWAMEAVELPAFWQWNYLSTDYRIPVTVVRTNAGRAMATNAMNNHVWADFSSESYRELPSPGPISYFDPYNDNGEQQFEPRHKTPNGAPQGGGGPGYYRVPTLISIWATAPFLHNNGLGLFNNNPSIDGRLEAFDDAIRKLLWPERRLESSSYNGATAERLRRDKGLIWRTTDDSYLVIKGKFVPQVVRQGLPQLANLESRFPWLANVSPFWLPSLSLFIAAYLLLKFSNNPSRRLTAVLVLILAAVLSVLVLAAFWYPSWLSLSWIRSVSPRWLPAIVLAVTGLILLWPISRWWTRCAGYAAILLSLFIGWIVYFNAGRLGDLRIGPIPKGTPVNLIANVNSEADPRLLAQTVQKTIDNLAGIESRHVSEEEKNRIMKREIAPDLMKINKCPDFVMDKGHYFEWFKTMTDDDKDALIELLKTF